MIFFVKLDLDYFTVKPECLLISLPKYYLDIENEFQVLTHLNESVRL